MIRFLLSVLIASLVALPAASMPCAGTSDPERSCAGVHESTSSEACATVEADTGHGHCTAGLCAGSSAMATDIATTPEPAVDGLQRLLSAAALPQPPARLPYRPPIS